MVVVVILNLFTFDIVLQVTSLPFRRGNLCTFPFDYLLQLRKKI